MFSPDYYGFPYPLFVTACHMGVQWGLSALTLTVFKGLRSKNRPASKDYV
jgi:solute carrier family 35 protein C2